MPPFLAGVWLFVRNLSLLSGWMHSCHLLLNQNYKHLSNNQERNQICDPKKPVEPPSSSLPHPPLPPRLGQGAVGLCKPEPQSCTMNTFLTSHHTHQVSTRVPSAPGYGFWAKSGTDRLMLGPGNACLGPPGLILWASGNWTWDIVHTRHTLQPFGVWDVHFCLQSFRGTCSCVPGDRLLSSCLKRRCCNLGYLLWTEPPGDCPRRKPFCLPRKPGNWSQLLRRQESIP